MKHTYDLRIAGIHIRILATQKVQLPESFRPFIVTEPQNQTPDWEMDVSFGNGSISLSDGDIVKRFPCHKDESFLRIEPADRKNSCRLVVPERLAEMVCEAANWPRFLMLERVFLPFDRMFLHASGIIHEGEAILFTAPSGGGKSTQAALWEKTFGAEIFNGDKIVIAASDTPPTCYGSPIAGSSLIYKNAYAPLKAIVYLHKAPENRIVQLDERHAFMYLYSQAVKSHDDVEFNQYLLTLIAKIVKTTPVLELYCKPDKTAPECLHLWLKDHCV